MLISIIDYSSLLLTDLMEGEGSHLARPDKFIKLVATHLVYLIVIDQLIIYKELWIVNTKGPFRLPYKTVRCHASDKKWLTKTAKNRYIY